MTALALAVGFVCGVGTLGVALWWVSDPRGLGR